MRLRLLALVALLALAVIAAPADAKPRAAKRLAAFGSCERLIGYASRHVPVPRARPVPEAPALDESAGSAPDKAAPVPAAGGAPEDTSQTNVQEAGVDEPDTVKTDGDTIFALANSMLHAVDARSDAPRLLGTLQLEEAWGASMFLHGKRVYVLGTGPRGVRITQVDVSDPANLVVRRTEDVDGYLVDARLSDGTARVVVASSPEAVYGPAELRSLPSGWLPTQTVRYARTGRTVTSRAVGCRSVRRPSVFSGAGVLTVHTVDLDKGLPAVDADAVFTSADTVYASPSSLYVATQRWDVEAERTSIHRFDTSDPDRTGYAASGAVPGTLLNQFSLSEDKGVLRTATTVGWGTQAESKVTTLSQRGGQLVQRGQVGGLGPGERIYAVRFIGDVGYVVTFRQTDPLYTVDLADPDRPRVVGELKIPGYSAYLHPVGDDLLLGVGQEATDDGRVQGLQLSLFDVSNLARPVRLQKAQLGQRFSSSAAEWDHHAFLWWPPAKLALLPIESEPFTGMAGFRVERAGGIAELGRISHAGTDPSWTPPVHRAVVVGDKLFTISDFGVKANGLASFGERGWAAFPQPPEPDCDMPVPLPGIVAPVPCPIPAD